MYEKMATPLRPRDTYNLRPAEIALDRDAILHVCQVSSLGCTSDTYRWKYETNPVRDAWCEVVVESTTGRVVGTTALFPCRLLIDGVPFRAAVAGDFAVDPKHRTLFTAIALQKAAVKSCVDGHFDVLYAFPNNASRPIQVRAGYHPIGSIKIGVRLLQTSTFLSLRGHAGWWIGAVGALDWAVAHLSRESRVRSSKDYLFCPLAKFDSRFDHFWASSLKRYPVVLERTSIYANWRFMNCPAKKYSVFAAVHRETDEIGGYIVSWSELGKTRISDIMAFDDVFDGLLAAFIGSERQRGTHALTIAYLGSKALIRQMRRFGFIFRQTPSQVVVRTTPELPASQRLLDPDNWYLLEVDSDT